MRKVILITGASRGIGAATARLAAARGFAVGVNYREDEAGAQAVVEEIKQAGGEAAALKADLGREADVQALFEALDRQLGRLTALVNNAAPLGAASAARGHRQRSRAAHFRGECVRTLRLLS